MNADPTAGPGPVSSKLQFLADYLDERADEVAPLSVEELHQVAGTINALLPFIEAMEARPVPKRFRVLDGGRSRPTLPHGPGGTA
jgi:hypothetical protein